MVEQLSEAGGGQQRDGEEGDDSVAAEGRDEGATRAQNSADFFNYCTTTEVRYYCCGSRV